MQLMSLILLSALSEGYKTQLESAMTVIYNCELKKSLIMSEREKKSHSASPGGLKLLNQH